MSYLKLKTCAAFLLCVMMLSLYPAAPVLAAEPNDYVLMLSAQASESPAKIRLQWPGKPTPTSENTYYVYRKGKEEKSWGPALAKLNGDATSYEDTSVTVGHLYEYKVDSANYTGYICAGIKAPAVESRGKVVLLVEAEQASALKAELETLKKDLIGDGWGVLRHDVSRNAAPDSVRSLVQKDYNADPANVKAVYLLGHIPVFKSGKLAPDAHADHVGPWPADVFYGNMTSAWGDSPTQIPHDVQLQVGRVDFDNMPAFQKNATELLRQYLNKSHRYKIGQMTTTKDALISDGFGRGKIDNAAVNNGYKLFPTLWGPGARIDDGSWKEYLAQNTYTWGHINGPGSYTSCSAAGGMFTTSYLASAQDFGIIFCQTFGSYFGDWNSQNNFMRAFLAMPDYGLTNAWTGRPNWFFHHMAMGETIGYSTRLTQNNSSFYTPTGMTGKNQVHIALMGDPTLRMFPTLPVSNLKANSLSKGDTKLEWAASKDSAVTGYYVYGASNPDGPYTWLDTVKGTMWTHENPGKTEYYMVRASKLTSTGSGSFYNLSQGVMAKSQEAADEPEPADEPKKDDSKHPVDEPKKADDPKQPADEAKKPADEPKKTDDPKKPAEEAKKPVDEPKKADEPKKVDDPKEPADEPKKTDDSKHPGDDPEEPVVAPESAPVSKDPGQQEDVTVKMRWNDNDNAKQLRPSQVEVTLSKKLDGKKGSANKGIAAGRDGWRYGFYGLDAKVPGQYDVAVITVPGYDTIITPDPAYSAGKGFIVTHTLKKNVVPKHYKGPIQEKKPAQINTIIVPKVPAAGV